MNISFKFLADIVDYKLKDASSAYLIISQAYGSSNNHILNTASNQISIDVSGYQTGVYNVTLIRNGQAVAVKTFVKQ